MREMIGEGYMRGRDIRERYETDTNKGGIFEERQKRGKYEREDMRETYEG